MWPAAVQIYCEKKTGSALGPGGTPWISWWGVCHPVLQILTHFRPKTIIFHTRFQTWPLTNCHHYLDQVANKNDFLNVANNNDFFHSYSSGIETMKRSQTPIVTSNPHPIPDRNPKTLPLEAAQIKPIWVIQRSTPPPPPPWGFETPTWPTFHCLGEPPGYVKRSNAAAIFTQAQRTSEACLHSTSQIVRPSRVC